jgi:hypothetical protein
LRCGENIQHLFSIAFDFDILKEIIMVNGDAPCGWFWSEELKTPLKKYGLLNLNLGHVLYFLRSYIKKKSFFRFILELMYLNNNII